MLNSYGNSYKAFIKYYLVYIQDTKSWNVVKIIKSLLKIEGIPALKCKIFFYVCSNLFKIIQNWLKVYAFTMYLSLCYMSHAVLYNLEVEVVDWFIILISFTYASANPRRMIMKQCRKHWLLQTIKINLNNIIILPRHRE